MRIVIAGPAKTGNVWLKCLLGRVYGLTWLKGHDLPTEQEFRDWAGRGGFPDGTVFHRHYEYSSALCDAVAEVPAHVVTIVRDPYDVFVSQFFTFQRELVDNPARFARLVGGGPGLGNRPAGGPAIGDPGVLLFLASNRFRANLAKADAWLRSGRSVVVRYEDLKADTAGELERVTRAIAPAEPERIAAAVDACSIERMRQAGGGQAKHLRKGVVGDSYNHLTEAHLAIFREQYGDLVRGLGYEVR